MKVALVKPPPTYVDWYRRPILGISYISAFLKSQGIDCQIFDAQFNLWTQEELIHRIVKYRPTLVGFTAMTHEIIPCSQIAVQLKKRLDIPTVVGGPHFTAMPERTLNEFAAFDYGVIGEGEKTMLELVQFLQQNGTRELPGNIMGIAFRDSSGRVCTNKLRELSTSSELDMLPFPDFEDYYREPDALAHKDAEYMMISSRGCPYHCAFCMQVLGRKVRRRSAQNVIDEIENAISRWRAHSFKFNDEIFLFNNRETHELLNLMIDKSLPERIRWGGCVRANLVSEELIKLAKKAGCYRLEIGVESGDDEILKAVDKGITTKQIKNAVRIIKESGITTNAFYILGHPNETKETIKKTIRLAAELNTDTLGVGIMVPYPGTRIYDMAVKGEGGYRLLTENWAEYDLYGGEALELGQLTAGELAKWQKYCFIYFYLRNFRFLDLIKFVFKYRRGIIFILKKLLPRSSEKVR
ncbi:MAG: B12-binding domain-containing radical SAM protein [Candidatus Tectomicrobia bacterium]|uniref:B12-binding domain-containing radical SAM protein n=1 Tax=Tectimicrobiota bacterium TaxID=2528274 RepID=A0A933GL61_UNCTE|nr:B12-binding domain-containing radical SAM protein [Candidatus Tectomicrobia bacterium]